MKKILWFFLSAAPLIIYGILTALFYFLFTLIVFRMGWFQDSWLFSEENIDASLMLPSPPPRVPFPISFTGA